MSNDNLFAEINEELRNEQLRNLWKRFGAWIIAAMVVVVIGVGAWEVWKWYEQDKVGASSDAFYEALTLADGSDAAAAQAALEKLATTGWSGYQTLARFRAAALLGQQGKADEAVAAYDSLATTQTNPKLRSVALVLGAYLAVDKGDVAAIEQRVGGLVEPTNPMRNAAREAIGLAKYKAGDLQGAREQFQAIFTDNATSSEQRQRVQIYLSMLISQGIIAPVAADAAATDAAPAAAPAAADAAAPAQETSVGDAPAMDVSTGADAAPAATDAAPAAAAGTETAPAPAN